MTLNITALVPNKFVVKGSDSQVYDPFTNKVGQGAVKIHTLADTLGVSIQGNSVWATGPGEIASIGRLIQQTKQNLNHGRDPIELAREFLEELSGSISHQEELNRLEDTYRKMFLRIQEKAKFNPSLVIDKIANQKRFGVSLHYKNRSGGEIEDFIPAGKTNFAIAGFDQTGILQPIYTGRVPLLSVEEDSLRESNQSIFVNGVAKVFNWIRSASPEDIDYLVNNLKEHHPDPEEITRLLDLAGQLKDKDSSSLDEDTPVSDAVDMVEAVILLTTILEDGRVIDEVFNDTEPPDTPPLVGGKPTIAVITPSGFEWHVVKGERKVA